MGLKVEKSDLVLSKTYTDAQIAAAIAAAIAAYVTLSAYTDEDSENNAMLKTHAYKAQTDGMVFARVTNENAKFLRSYVGLTDNPVGAGILIQSAGDLEGSYRVSVSALVAKDEYFEITYDGTYTPSIVWKSFGTLIKPIDFN